MEMIIKPLYRVLRKILEECEEKQKLLEIEESASSSCIGLIRLLHHDSFFGFLKESCSAIEAAFKAKCARIFMLSNDTAFFFSLDKNTLTSIELSKSLVDIDFSLENTLTESILGERVDFVKYIPLPTHCKEISCTLELCYSGREAAIEIEPQLIEGIAKAIDNHRIKFNVAIQKTARIVRKQKQNSCKRHWTHWRNSCPQATTRSEDSVSSMSELEHKIKEVIESKETQEKIIGEQREQLADGSSLLRRAVEEYEETRGEVEHLRSERVAKLKFLAAALLYSQLDACKAKEAKLFLAWNAWKHNIFCGKIVTSSLKEIGELNRMHVNKRCSVGVGIVGRCVKNFNKKMLRRGFLSIIRFNQQNSLY